MIESALVYLDFDDLISITDEQLENVLEAKTDKEPEPIKPQWEKKRSKVRSFDLHPDIPLAERNTFDLRNHPVEPAGKKERFHRNMEAIRVLKECEAENRFATPAEQIILSKYVGWGGLSEAFDERNSAWADEFLELRMALSSEEYAAARESTLTAFYTPLEVTTAIYKAMEQMGFKEGNLLEPSCGIGNFIGMLPESMANTKIYGVELDRISAGIAQQLYQKSSIAAQGFEEVNVQDSFFDGVVGNVPFGDFKVLDKRYDKYNFLVHDYFFAKSLDKLRPGGVMALVTSKGTMDKTNSSVRKYIAQRADLLGAIRFPNNTFKDNAGTEVVSDILFLQKRDRLIDIEPDWVQLRTNDDGFTMNAYFVQHPEMILGEMKMVSGRFGEEATCLPFENADLSELLSEAVANIHGEVRDYEVEDELEEEDRSIPANPEVRNFSYTVVEDNIYFRENSRMNPVEVSATAENRIKGLIAVRDCVRNLIELQTEGYPDEDIRAEQIRLNTLYDNYTKKYGLINSRANISAFSDDSSFALLSALEVLNENGELERKADMFFKRTIQPHKPVTKVDTASDALAVSMGEKAGIDMEYMQELSGKSEETLCQDLKGVIFLNPLYGYGNVTEPKYLMADEYLSGNVREKLALAKRTAMLYPEDYKSFKFTDINYAVASREDKEGMFLEYSELLNSLDSGATTKITINNRRLNRLDFEKTILIPETGDNLDEYREEYNKMLLEKATGANSTVQDKYVTISINKKNVDDARTYFARVGADLIAHFNRLGSKCVEMETDERLRIIHDFFRVGEESAYHFDIKETRKKGHDFKDYICPDSMEFESDYFKIGNRFGRVIFLREYASYIKDSMVAELTDMNRNLMMSIDIVPVPTDEAVREAENRLLGVETNITNWQRKQNQNNNFSATVPYDMEQQKKEMKEFLDDLTTRDQRMMFAVLTMVHTADTKEQLDNDTEALLTTARKHLCQFAVLKYQQMDGLNTVMPYGTRKIDSFRTLTTESLAVFMPFRVQDIYDENGIYYGQNVISKNMIIADRKQLLNGNSFILGVSGGGKSFAAKGEIENIILSSDADVIIIDPEREYSHLVNALGGEIINISATSPNHINAMDMNKDYGDGANPVILKSEFIMSLCEQLIGGTNLGAKQKSIIDRCTASVYRMYQQNDYTGSIPTLQDFRDELLKQDEPEAKEIALAIELFTHGSLNTFAKQTNVDTHNRLICYDILDLGKQLMPIGMLVVLDSILNRITQNRAKGKNTFIFIDEIYLLFQHEYSANFLFTLWKRVRKYGAYASGITQNVDDLLQSHTARTMLANSEFIIMLNQASTDRLELAKLLNISDLQLSYITNVDAGHGLIKVGSSLVPFANKFPKNTKLYKLMTTKPGEV